MPGRKAPEHERREQLLQAAMRVAVARRLEGLTIREVARESGLSAGLVLFHFTSREGLIRALLDWLLAEDSLLQPRRSGARTTATLGALIRAECRRLMRGRERTELFFDFWVAGTRRPALRKAIQAALQRYRQDVQAVVAEALGPRAGACSGGDAEAVAAAIVSFIHGCAVQAVMDPQHFDLDAALAVATALADGEPGRSARRRRRAP